MRPIATYRVQLRNGVTFADVQRDLPRLARLGVSHLYLSPILRASAGSTHGYDVADPTRIDEDLGGAAGFAALAQAAQAQGLAVLIDIVPNHTAFTPENPWLADVLRHGKTSRYARHFDIDWSAGPLVLPFLPEPFEAMARAGAFTVSGGHSPTLDWEGLSVPLKPGSVDGVDDTPEGLLALHSRQHWTLADRALERDGITHRRFFNVTGLIGMRVEDREVFDDMHRCVLDLVRSGQVQALRIDHIDGLARPAEYLERLRQAAGDAPIWVEKILTGDEPLPPWPVEGTTGYEAAVAISALLTEPSGLKRLDAVWREATGIAQDYAQALAEAKAAVLDYELAAEVLKLVEMANGSVDAAAEFGGESLREAVRALLTAFPRYRTYLGEGDDAADRALLAEVVEAAATGLRDDRAVRALVQVLAAPEGEGQLAFRTRFQQTTGAVMAKSHEDTALFRYTRYLAANEVGSEPDRPSVDAATFAAWATARGRDWPEALTLTSSHDTKRAEDSRMRIAAITHRPDDYLELWQQACALLPDIDAAHRWYLLQSWLALHVAGRDDLSDRLVQHMEKALREAKQVTTPTHPVAEAEAPVLDAARALSAAWNDDPPPPAQRLFRCGEDLSLAQTALKLLLPGVPDIYQGSETGAFQLTDPDNRLPVDFHALSDPHRGEDWSGRKHDLIERLLAFHRDRPGFARRSVEGAQAGPEMRMRFLSEAGTVHLHLAPGAAASAPAGQPLWPADQNEAPVRIGWEAAAG